MSRSSSRRARRWARGSSLAFLTASTALGAAFGFVAVGAGSASASPVSPVLKDLDVSTVYTQTNQVAGNAVLAYRAEPDGSLTPIGTYPTGGTGTGESAASQGAVTLGDNNQLLAVANGGSGTVSVFAVGRLGGLQLVEVASSGGAGPISVTIDGLWVYALNAGNATTPANISGFEIGANARSTRDLNPGASSPEQVSFSPSGRDLVVTEKASDTIDVFPVGPSGLAGSAVTTHVTTGTAPYGFAFTPNGYAVVSDAGTGALSTFAVNPNGTLHQVSQVPDGQLAPCWVVLSASGREAFTTNAHSGTVSAYDVAPNGTLTLVNPAVQASPGIGDTDIAVAGNNDLYISDQPNFDVSSISSNGSLSPSSVVASGLPAGTFGLAATGAVAA